MSAISYASIIVVPIFVAIVVIYGAAKKVKIYDEFVKGAKGGVGTVLKILPFMVGMIFAVDIFKASGCFDYLSAWLSPAFKFFGIPPEILPLALMRPFSGGASIGILAGLFSIYGTDSYIGRVASTIMGSSETMFYTIALYCGNVGVTKTRYIVPVGILTDLAGIITASIICLYFF